MKRLCILVLSAASCSTSCSSSSSGTPPDASGTGGQGGGGTVAPGTGGQAGHAFGGAPGVGGQSGGSGAPGSGGHSSTGSGGASGPPDAGAPETGKAPDASTTETGASTGLTFTIDVGKGPARQFATPSAPTKISPYVYGINGFGKFVASKTRWGLIRQGGDACTAYNWTVDYSNAGADYCFYQGVSDTGNLAGKYVDAAGDTIPAAQAKGEAFLATVPILDFVAAKYDRNTGWDPNSNGAACPGTDSACPKRSGQYSANVVDPNPGDPGYGQALDFASSDPASPAFVKNVMSKGSAFCSCAPGSTGCTDCSVGTNPVAEDEFVNFLKVNYGSGAPIFFSLDNEPNYWPGTHAELWANTCGDGTVTYDDIVSRNQTAATAIKNAWPSALVFGPVVAQDGIVYAHSYQNDSHWPTEFSDYYLAQMHAASVAAGKSLLDVFDVHYYTSSGAGDSDCVQTPRLFWDPNFTEVSASDTDKLDFGWSGDVGSGAYFDNKLYPRQMIPRLQKKIAAAYPAGEIATPGLSFSEYNPGCETSIGGGVGEADLLGVFGREGVFAATAWPLQSTSGNFLIAAFDLYRNYDGASAVVGDTAVLASTTDAKTTSVYAFSHSDGSAGLEVVAINKKTSTQTVSVQIADAPSLTTAALYQIAGKTAAVAKVSGSAPAITCAAATCTFSYTMPAMSATTVVLR